jgi:hypothetical protein
MQEAQPDAMAHQVGASSVQRRGAEEWPWAANNAMGPDGGGASTANGACVAVEPSAEPAACKARQPSWDRTLQALCQLVKDPAGAALP